MKSKDCDNTLLYVFLGILLLIVLWYVLYGRNTLEKFALFTADINGDNDPDAVGRVNYNPVTGLQGAYIADANDNGNPDTVGGFNTGYNNYYNNGVITQGRARDIDEDGDADVAAARRIAFF